MHVSASEYMKHDIALTTQVARIRKLFLARRAYRPGLIFRRFAILIELELDGYKRFQTEEIVYQFSTVSLETTT